MSYGYTGTTFTGSGGVPVDIHTREDIYGTWEGRPAPQVGGCGCGLQAHPQSGGHRPFSFDLTDNSLGKTYASVSTLPCGQRGGQQSVITRDRAGYSMGNPVITPSAIYLEKMPFGPYGTSRMPFSGGRRRRRRNSHRRHRF